MMPAPDAVTPPPLPARPDEFEQALVEELRPLLAPLSACAGTAAACVWPGGLHWIATHPTCDCSQRPTPPT